MLNNHTANYFIRIFAVKLKYEVIFIGGGGGGGGGGGTEFMMRTN